LYFRYNDAFTRHDLGIGIRKAYTCSDNGAPATVRHWDTLANISKWLEVYTKDFTEGCMKFRHFRMFRSTTEGTVWLQATSNINCWFDAEDEWRGLKDKTTHTVPFTTAYGVPDLLDMLTRIWDMPRASRRDVNEDLLGAVEKSLDVLVQKCPAFTDEHRQANLDLVNMCRQDPMRFSWAKEDIMLLYGWNRKEDQPERPRHNGLAWAQVGKCFLIKPADDEEDPFLVGLIRYINPSKPTYLHVEFFTPTEEGEDVDFYTCRYKSVGYRKSITDDQYPTVHKDAMQLELPLVSKKVSGKGRLLTFKLADKCLKDIRYYAARWKGGADLERHSHELCLDLEA
jgi:hypothetical protein